MAPTDDDDAGVDAADEAERDERAAILKRRAKFVASALAGLSLAAGCSDAGPGACLKMSPAPGDEPSATSSTSAAPPATASATSEPPDAGVDAGGDDAGAGSASASSSASAPPQPCLEMAPPRPCLKVAPPKPCLKVAPKPCLDMPPGK